MKKTIITLFSLIILCSITGCKLNVFNSVTKKSINDINLLDNHYYLFYPLDSRTTQNYTYIKELDSKGNNITTYKIQDSNFRRVDSFQNPNHSEIVYLKLFGEASLESTYYKYNIKEHTFSEEVFDYFKYDVGINNFFTFGEDIILSTVTSHKTGEQNTTDDGAFQVSISNTKTQKSVETPYNSVPMITANFEFNKKGIYMTSSYIADMDTEDYENKGIGVVDFSKEKIEFFNPEKVKNLQYWSVYSNNENFYVFSDLGTLFKYDKNFSYQTFFPLTEYDDIYFLDYIMPMYISDDKILYSFYSGDNQIVGTISMKDNSFTELSSLNNYQNIKFLYHDTIKSEIYLVSEDNEDSGSLIILDSNNLSIKKTFSVDDPWSLDFVIHK